jgi:hypothetical protein
MRTNSMHFIQTQYTYISYYLTNIRFTELLIGCDKFVDLALRKLEPSRPPIALFGSGR